MIPPIDAMITSGRLTLPPTSDGCRCKQPKREAPAGERGASVESRRRFREIGHFRSQNRSVLNVREDSSTGSTHKLPAEVNYAILHNYHYFYINYR